jgi:hypothetical protein
VSHATKDPCPGTGCMSRGAGVPAAHAACG